MRPDSAAEVAIWPIDVGRGLEVKQQRSTVIETLTSDELEAQALHTTWPVALDFYQASCPPCRTLEPRLEKLAEQYVGRLPVYRVDVERDMAIAERFGVQSIPTVLILRDGKEVGRLDGLITDDDLKTAFDRAIRA